MTQTLGLDIGTGSAKAVAFEVERGVLSSGAASYGMSTPRPGWAEQDPADWWQAALDAIESAGRDTEAIAVSGQGAALVLLDAQGVPVRPALIHLDSRAADEAAELAASPVGKAVRVANGNRIGAWNTAAKLTWVRRHEPALWQRVSHITTAAGYVLWRLTGEHVVSASDAGISDLFELSSRSWSASVLEALELPIEMLPRIAEAVVLVGNWRGMRVVAGGEDTSSAALAAGVVRAGEGFVSLGTAGVAGLAIERGSPPEPRLLTFPHVRPDLDIRSGSMTSAGAAVEWCAGLAGTDAATLLREAEDVPAGADGVIFVPYLAGELHPIDDPAARGAFSGLSLSTTRAVLGRAIVEGSAGAIAHNLDVAGVPTRLVATGGPTRSRAWMQSVADAVGVPVDVVSDLCAPVGDAILAACDDDRDIPPLVARHRAVSASYAPDPDAHESAVRRRAMVRTLYEATS